MLHFTSDWHLDHTRILTYCGRTEFMTPVEQERYLEAKDKVVKVEKLVNTGERSWQDLKVVKEAMRKLLYCRETVDRMDTFIIDDVNSKAQQGDEIWHHGDVGFFGSVERFLKLRNRIVCRNIHLIWGNHDKDIRHWAKNGLINGAFKSYHDIAVIRWQGQKIVGCHTAFLAWEGSGRGVWHTYGHSHANLESWREEHLPRAKMVDVGVDYRAKLGKGYTMWSYMELQKYMESKEGQAVDHHGNCEEDD